MRLYIAGPMTGIPDFNYPAFNTAERVLAAMGYDVENPANNTNPSPDDYHEWLRLGLRQMMTCDGIALLDGWERSGGARMEVHVGAMLGMRVAPMYEWVQDAEIVNATNPPVEMVPVEMPAPVSASNSLASGHIEVIIPEEIIPEDEAPVKRKGTR